ncbi:MAG TPA: ABC transporter transmembrane domain-containing protein, partial [Rubrobacteraceae bacterium]
MKRLIELRARLGRAKETLSNFTPFLRPRRAGLLLALLLLLLETGMSLAQPWPLALALDYVLNDRKQLPGFWPEGLSAEALLLAGIAFLLVFITTASRGLSAFRRYLLQKLGQGTVFDMRAALYRRVHDLGLDYHGKKRTGDTITRVTSDVKEVRTLLVDSIVEVGS